MKFFHLGDLHFGKTLQSVRLAESDQPFWVEQFLKAVDEHNPDAIVIAGDVYDTKDPTAVAMNLFGHFLTELAKRDKYVFIIPGNHDSIAQLSHVNSLLTANKIYIAGDLRRKLPHITVHGDVDVTFWLMPFLFPKLVCDPLVLNRDRIASYDEAARALLSVQDLDPSACNVLIAHQNVLASGVRPEHSESETIIGGVGEIDYTAFDLFDYVALGHIHNAQAVGRETVRYSGCPLYYDFSEIDRVKDLTMVTINSKEDIRIEQIPITLQHRLIQLSGTLEEVVAQGMALENKENYYIQCILTERHTPPRALEQLRDVFGNQMVGFKLIAPEFSVSPGVPGSREAVTVLPLEDQFTRFYLEQTGCQPDEIQSGLIMQVLEQQTRCGSYFDLDSKKAKIPEEDSQELLDYLLNAVKEDEQ